MLYSQSFHLKDKCFNLMVVLVKKESHHKKELTKMREGPFPASLGCISQEIQRCQ